MVPFKGPYVKNAHIREMYSYLVFLLLFFFYTSYNICTWIFQLNFL